MNAASFKVFGIPMQQQRKRRQLVVITYAALALVLAATIAGAPRYPMLYSYSIYATIAVALFVFGGTGQRGLLKGFENRPPRAESPQIEIIRMNLAPRTMLSTADSSWRNDERELHRRDLAHYRAYQPLGVGVMLLLLLSTLALHPWPWLPLAVVHVLSFAVAEMMTMLYVTLPAAIILWTEPDIDLE
jgi:hypothetical protein